MTEGQASKYNNNKIIKSLSDTFVWLGPSLSGTVPPSPSPAVGGAPHTGGRSVGLPGRLLAEALLRGVFVASSAPVCA